MCGWQVEAITRSTVGRRRTVHTKRLLEEQVVWSVFGPLAVADTTQPTMVGRRGASKEARPQAWGVAPRDPLAVVSKLGLSIRSRVGCPCCLLRPVCPCCLIRPVCPCCLVPPVCPCCCFVLFAPAALSCLPVLLPCPSCLPLLLPCPSCCCLVFAHHKRAGTGPGELTFNQGDVLTVFGAGEPGWLDCEVLGRRGLAPANYVEML
jgi:hypothetical protein